MGLHGFLNKVVGDVAIVSVLGIPAHFINISLKIGQIATTLPNRRKMSLNSGLSMFKLRLTA